MKRSFSDIQVLKERELRTYRRVVSIVKAHPIQNKDVLLDDFVEGETDTLLGEKKGHYDNLMDSMQSMGKRSIKIGDRTAMVGIVFGINCAANMMATPEVAANLPTVVAARAHIADNLARSAVESAYAKGYFDEFAARHNTFNGNNSMFTESFAGDAFSDTGPIAGGILAYWQQHQDTIGGTALELFKRSGRSLRHLALISNEETIIKQDLLDLGTPYINMFNLQFDGETIALTEEARSSLTLGAGCIALLIKEPGTQSKMSVYESAWQTIGTTLLPPNAELGNFS